MLKTINLDTSTFQEMFTKNKQYLQTFLPYIDVNRDSEPAVTLLEMMTMLSDIQNYNINLVLPSHLEKYMALLGVIKKPGQSARGHVCVYPQEDSMLLSGTAFIARDDQRIIHFESIAPVFVIQNNILGCFLQVQNTLTPFFNCEPITLVDVKVQYLYIFFKQPIDTICRLYFTLFDNQRNSGIKSSYLEARIEVEYYSDNGWRKCLAVQDETNGLLQSGSLIVQLYFSHTAIQMQEKKGYPIRLKICQANYEIVPVIQRIELNPIELIQKKTLLHQREITTHKTYIEYVHELEKKGNILILQKQNKGYLEVPFSKENNGIRLLDNQDKITTYLLISQDISLEREKYVFDILGISSQQIVIDIPNVDDQSLQLFYKKNNRYYIFEDYYYDSDKQIIHLGNGKDFPIFPASQESLFISQLSTTLYQDGSIRQNTLTCEKTNIYCIDSQASFGSAASETVEQMIDRLKEMYGKQMDIVDTYRKIVKQTPYLPIKEVGIFFRQQFYHQDKEEGFVIVVEKTTKKALTRKQKQLIYQQVKKQAYVNTAFEIRSLKYIPVTIHLYVQLTKPNNKDKLKQVIHAYIEKEELQEWCLRKQELQVNILQLANVLQIANLKIQIQNKDVERYIVAPDIRLQIISLTVDC